MKYYEMKREQSIESLSVCMNLKVILLSERSQTRKVFTVSFININFKNEQNEVNDRKTTTHKHHWFPMVGWGLSGNRPEWF